MVTLDADVTSYSDMSLQETTRAHYRVVAYNLAGSSPYSAEATATTWINAPTNLQVNEVLETEIEIGWEDNSSVEAGYLVERKSSSDFEEVMKLSTDAVSFSDTGLTGSTTYEFRVAAYNEVDTSTYSNVLSVTTLEIVLSSKDPHNIGLVIYPNPSKDALRIESGKSIDRIEVYNIAGKLVEQKAISGAGNNTLDLPDLTSGTYDLKIYLTNKEILNRRIVLE